MSQDNIRIPDEIAQEVLDLASQYYSEYQDSYTDADLIQIGSEVEIPAELIEKAIADIQLKQKQKNLAQQQQQEKQALFKKIGFGSLVLMGIWGVFTFNQLSAQKSAVKAAWAQVENQQQRRADLIPDLVNITKTYANQEERIVTQLVNAQESYLTAQTSVEKNAAIATVNEAINDFTEYSVSNPQLSSNQLFINLQYELAGTANRLAVERKRYNEAASQYEQSIESFPNVIIAKIAGFNAAEFTD
ncbi:LemA family protein [Picosynechococcus sp. NKBG15041c]|uniref:LemA family protein n=1 Tax=Picosynechococcus sp. NKBG15041c TaxID=1407650 RepID=UPI0004058984|nr:LemA family protein [Picosynechococcus sp. NKBG15041c]